MMILKKAVLVALFIFIAFGILYPNPYGNNPDIIPDESYFLSTSLFAFEKMTLPGWEFTPSGAYYGGPQTYLDALVLIPVIGGVFASADFSLIETKLWVAQNTGELLHLLRLVNGVIALGALLFSLFYFKKRRIPKDLALTLALYLFLLLSNVLVIQYLHTAKMWVFYIILVSVTSSFFIANEHYLSKLGQPFIRKEHYVALLVWSGILTFFQSWIGVFSIALLALYAILLRHVSAADFWAHVKKYWYLIVLFSVTQISFLWRAYTIFYIFRDATTRTAEGAVDWLARLGKPFQYVLETHPLSLLYALALSVLIGFFLVKKPFLSESRRRHYIWIAAVHPLLVYLIFHVGFGFDIGARYAILLTLAFAFSATILLSEIGMRAAFGALAVSITLFAVINTHAIRLYWHQSSETDLLETILAKYNSPDNLFIVDWSAKRLTLPVNYKSLDLLSDTRQDMGRFRFLLENRELMTREPDFKPLTALAYSKDEENVYISKYSPTHSVWMIRRDCTNRCTSGEIQAGTCFELHIEACIISPHDVNTLPVFLSSQQLGNSYIVRKVNE